VALLDQQRHEAVVHATRTLYAGISPRAIEPAAGTMLFSMQCIGWRRDSGHRLRIDLDHGGRIDGGLLPSRTPTAFGTASVGTVRERLRFRRRDDGALDLMAGPGLAPVAGDATVLVRTFDGGYYRGGADGRLVRIDEAAAAHTIEALCDAHGTALTVESEDPYRVYHPARRHFPVATPDPSESVAAMLDLPGALAPGSYLARVGRFEGIDLLGLDVRFHRAEHLVLGRLAPEDVLD
jgi:hypothetical protein